MGELSIAVLSVAGCVFAASSAAKLRSRRAYRAFRAGLGETGLVPGRLRPAAAALLSGTEAAAAAGLLAGAALTAAAAAGAVWVAESALAAAVLLTMVLTAGVVVVIHRGTQARCACFGARSTRPLGRVHLARNLALLVVLGAGLAGTPLAQEHVAPAGAALAVATGGVVALLFVRGEELAGLFAPIPTSGGNG